MIGTAPEFEQLYEQSKTGDIEGLIDQHYDSLGLEDIDAQWIREAYEDAGVIDSEDDYTFLIPRQQPASTVEQISMAQVAEMLGDQLQEDGEIGEYSVVGAPLSDKMYGRNAEKRGYAMPVVATDEGLRQAQIADIRDGYSIGSHRINCGEGSQQVVDEELGGDPEASDLREMHDSLENPIVETRGDFTDIQRSMIEEMIDHGQEPEILGFEDSDGKIVGLKYDAETGRYESLDDRRDISLSMDEASKQGILTPETNYEALIFPSALHEEIGYMLRGLENGKFRTENTDELERQAELEGLDTFPFIDVSSRKGYDQAVPREVMKELKDTKFGRSSSLKNSGIAVNIYPSQRKRQEIKASNVEADRFQDVTEQILNMTLR
ncbi:hypothetical protein AQV86_01840 [Nanohaloarchaea archaeon SG9]|nr:hypothetical protein AQV86_01840 [Nanohaloarchaea archaeon SG9]